jgi:hypothetical protein
MQHRGGLAAGPGHRRAAGVGLEASGVGEPGAVVTDLGQHPGAGHLGQAGHAGDDRRVRMLDEAFGGGGREVLGVGARGVQLTQQSEGLSPEGLLHRGRMVQVVAAQHMLESCGFGVEAALQPGAAQQRPQPRQAQLGRRPRGGRGGQQRAGLGAQQPAALVREGLEECGVELAQQ